MDSSTFKKITYGIVALTLLTVIYLAFIRDDSPTSRNADFLGLKNNAENKNITNQKDLTIDGTVENNKSTENKNDVSTTQQKTTNKSGFYTVKEGDTYGCIAEAYYGSYEHWPSILNANSRYGHGFSEYELHVGAVLEMPVITTENLKPASKLCS